MVNCSICLDVIKCPTCCVPCGHVFCQICIGRWQRQNAIYGTERGCPQCRCPISHAQRVRFDTTDPEELLEYNNGTEDPWDESDVGNILKSLENIWKRSQIRRMLKNGQDRLLSHEGVKRVWYCVKDGWNTGRQLVNDVQQLQGFDNRVNLLKTRFQQGLLLCKQKVVNHPYTVSLKQRWHDLSEDWKHVLVIIMAICVVLLFVDVQNKDGLVQSVIFPVFTTFFFICREFLSAVAYIIVRPLYCSLLCTMEVATTIADVTIETLASLIHICREVGILPLVMAMGLIQVITTTVGMILRTVIPLFILLYFISPSVQYHCRTMLARLQQQNQQPNQQPNQQQNQQQNQDGT